MASSTPGSAPPSLGGAPIVAAVQGSQRPMPRLPASPGPYGRAWRRLRSARTAMVMLASLCGLIAAVLLLPLAIAIDPFQQSLKDSLLAPGAPGHPLGTDQFGRDVLLRLIDGGRASLSVGFAAVPVAAGPGGALRPAGRLRGGRVERLLLRPGVGQVAVAGILLALLLAAMPRP